LTVDTSIIPVWYTSEKKSENVFVIIRTKFYGMVCKMKTWIEETEDVKMNIFWMRITFVFEQRWYTDSYPLHQYAFKARRNDTFRGNMIQDGKSGFNPRSKTDHREYWMLLKANLDLSKTRLLIDSIGER
jgi:hypothetical protein